MTQLQTFFAYLNKFFDHVYVITIERAKDRHVHIEKELHGLNYEMFFGKDKQFFKVEELKAANIYDEELAERHHRYQKPMHAGQIGCAWSHAEVYKDIIAKRYETVLILEDDVVIDQRFIHTAIEVLDNLPPNWELLYLGFAGKEIPPPNASIKKAIFHALRTVGLFKYNHKTINRLYPNKVAAHLYEAGYHDCTHAYAIKLATAKKLLQLQQPISFVADNLLAYAITNDIVTGYIMLPKVINQQYQVGIESTCYLNH